MDCYPYTFSPLLLFSESDYFDKGHSNYNSVAEFFRKALGEEVDALKNVLFESKNLKYDELFRFVVDNQMLVVCCIDSHFTAFQVLKNKCVIYYDPLSSTVQLISSEESF